MVQGQEAPELMEGLRERERKEDRQIKRERQGGPEGGGRRRC